MCQRASGKGCARALGPPGERLRRQDAQGPPARSERRRFPMKSRQGAGADPGGSWSSPSEPCDPRSVAREGPPALSASDTMHTCHRRGTLLATQCPPQVQSRGRNRAHASGGVLQGPSPDAETCKARQDRRGRGCSARTRTTEQLGARGKPLRPRHCRSPRAVLATPACAQAGLALRHAGGAACVLHSVKEKLCDKNGADVATCQTMGLREGGMSGNSAFFSAYQKKKNILK